MATSQDLRNDAFTIWKSGVAAVDARRLVQETISIVGDTLSIGNRDFLIGEIDRIIVVGFGKASGAMAVGLERALACQQMKSIPIVGQVNVPTDQVLESEFVSQVGCRPPGENLPTQEVLDATDAMIDLVSSAGPRDICVCLISGGGSALLEKPVHPISLAELRAVTVFLSGAGASIYELNAVRRAISEVKGGRLASRSGGAPVVALIVSDVIGDDLDVVASGPTVEPTSGVVAIDVLYRLDPERTRVPNSIWQVVESGAIETGRWNSTSNVFNQVIGNLQTAMLACRAKAVELGYLVTMDEPAGDEGDATVVGRSVAIQIAQASLRPGRRCEIMGGETTVRLCESPGSGGRNQQLVLAALHEVMQFRLGSESAYCLLSAGTDGEDGNVPVAGAWMDSDWIATWDELQKQALLDRMVASLNGCDSHTFLSEHGLILQVPQTFTNVCDLRIVLAHSP